MISAQQVVARRTAASEGGQGKGAASLLGTSAAFRKALSLAQRSAAVDINVLLLGETGTGKELFARAVHDHSARRERPFVAVDCAVLPETLIEAELFGHERGAFTGAVSAQPGRFELAQGGTLFLDEIGNIPLALQAKLLRVLQERRLYRVGGREPIALDLRVIAATNVDLPRAIRAGRFRADLYYRLHEVTLRLPPLRERTGDIPLLAAHYARVYGQRFAAGNTQVPALSAEALDVLSRYTFPGNVRELENAMKAAAALARGEAEIRPEHLPPELLAPAATPHAGDGGAPPLGASSVPMAPTPPTPTVTSASTDGDALQVTLALDLKSGLADLKTVGLMAAEQAERELLRGLLSRQRVSTMNQLARMVNVDPKTLRSKLRKFQLDADLLP